MSDDKIYCGVCESWIGPDEKCQGHVEECPLEGQERPSEFDHSPVGIEPSQTRQARVSRYQGTCRFCGVETEVIEAYDPRVYPGASCADCILTGKASRLSPLSKIMLPMVFVARAIRGDEPFAGLLKAADAQRSDPKRAAKEAQAVASKLASAHSGETVRSRLVRKLRRAMRVMARRKP